MQVDLIAVGILVMVAMGAGVLLGRTLVGLPWYKEEKKGEAILSKTLEEVQAKAHSGDVAIIVPPTAEEIERRNMPKKMKETEEEMEKLLDKIPELQ